jgi:CheY-like chemotaxis protein
MISILIVDTDKITRDILLHLLEFELPHVAFHITARFESALEMCKIFRVNILITTTSVPPTQSDTMMEAIRTLGPDPIKIIIMTTESREVELNKLTLIPNTYVIGKPIDLNELVRMVIDKTAEIQDRTVC